MDNSLKNKNIYVIVFEIFIILLAVVGLTYSTSKILGSSSKTTIKTGEYEVDYKGDLEVTGENIEPISDDLININTKDSVLRAEFSFRGTESNKDEDLIYDIMLKDMNIDCAFLNEYTKWNLYKNGELLSTGNFSPSFDGKIKEENYHLTTIQEDLPKSTESYDDYVLIIWVSESCDDLATCKYVDQSNIVGKTISMTAFIALYSGEKTEYTRVPNADSTCANNPVLKDNMVPVYYKEGAWVIADEHNSNDNTWYNYSKGYWANAVVTKDNKYTNKKAGTIVEDSDITGFFVWIPRYKYETWNLEGTNSSKEYGDLINIEFESNTNSSGTVKCTNDVCTGKNGEYLTHPAFGDSKGLWVSKYEIGQNDTVNFISNVSPLQNKDIDEYEALISNFNTTYNLNSKIISNLEWGAITYLTYSKYGLCSNSICQELENNNEFINGKNKYDSTTRNIYGVYDMSGNLREYVTESDLIGSATSEYFTEENSKDISDITLFRGGTNIFDVSSLDMDDYSTRITIK